MTLSLSAERVAGTRHDAGSEARSLFKKPSPWTLTGLVLVLLAMTASIAEFKLPVLSELQADGIYKYITGFGLLSYIALQWKLFAHREAGKAPALAARWYRRHKTLGVLAPVPFVLHAGTFGHASVTVLSIVFFLVLVTGLLNRDLLCVSSEFFWRAWTVCHVGLAFAMYALVALHVWTAISFSS